MKITEPTLLVDEATVRQNIQKMAHKASMHGLKIKPHVKTHQSVVIGNWMRDYGISAITVSSVRMAEYFARSRWNDITIAFPCNPLLGNRLNKLAKRINLSILISDSSAYSGLAKVLTEDMKVYIEIDTGAHRTGFPSSDIHSITKLAEKIRQHDRLQFKGFYSHPGHSYRCRSKKDIQAIHQQVLAQMQQLKSTFEPSFPELFICIGDTPCCSIAGNFEGVDEISAGNFVFYDLMQKQIGACTKQNIAIALACPVVATYPDRLEIAVHAGSIHLSAESIKSKNEDYYGKIVTFDQNLCWQQTIDHCYVKSISQEHAIIQCSPSFFDSVTVGTIISILPVHSCLTADAMHTYFTTKTFDKIDHLRMV